MFNLGSMDFLIMRNHDYLFIIANELPHLICSSDVVVHKSL